MSQKDGKSEPQQVRGRHTLSKGSQGHEVFTSGISGHKEVPKKILDTHWHAHIDGLKQQIEGLKIEVELKETMKGQCARLEVQIQTLNAELRKVQEQSEQDKDALQVALAEKQSLGETHSILDDKYREKEAFLEKALAQISDLEDQLQKSRANHEHELQEQFQRLQSESTELRQQISKTNEEIAAWKGDCQAKTQQVKQYSKQVEQFRVQVDGLTAELRDKRAKIAEYEHQLGYYQEQVRQLDENEEQKAAIMKAQFESEMLHVNRDLERLRREKIKWEMTAKHAGDQREASSTCDEQAIAHVQSLNQQLDSFKRANYALDIELQSQQNKFLQVSEKCEIIWEQIGTLKMLLKKNNISVPKLELQQECTQLKAQIEELVEKEKCEQVQHQHELQQIQGHHQQELQQVQDHYQQELHRVQGQHQQELQRMDAEKQSMEQHLFLQESRILELERKLETANTEVKEVRFTQLLNPQGTDSSWNVPRNEVIVKEEIGRGASGLVSKGQFRGQSVAVKQIHQFILSQKHVINEFKREVRIMASVQHPNLVRFIGAVFDESVENFTATPLLLLELLHTNLRKAYEKRPSNLGASVMLSIFRDMAYGLHYLHEHQEPIIHRDVSAPNVLLEALPGGTWRAKLSDFGSANFLKRSSTLGVGAIICTAPEMFPRDDPSAPVPLPTVKSDVFSYGIVLVEIITKTMPSRENRHQLFQEVEQKWRMMHELVTWCTQRHPEDRPTMSVVLNQFNRFPVARPR